MNMLFKRKQPVIPIRGIHLDCKGLPPTPARLMELPDLLAELGINCMLVEWEDMYPWKRYPKLANATAYSPSLVRRFLYKACKLNIEIIPLIQCLGHMENVLSRKRFSGLRECPDNTAELCPSRDASRRLVMNMIDDILETHSGLIRYFHLGGDEAWSMGSCPECRRSIRRHGAAELYLRHVLPLTDFLKAKDIRPILWDDMMRKWPPEGLRKISGAADLMAWNYSKTPLESKDYAKIPLKDNIRRYLHAGIGVWGASAFKGACGATADLAKVEDRLANLLTWARAGRGLNLKGVVATGWSRYAYSFVPCESLEASWNMVVAAAWSMWDGALPDDAVARMHHFLQKGKMKLLAGDRFRRCYAAGEAVRNCRQKLMMELTVSAWICPVLGGEPERRNPHMEMQLLKRIADLRQEGARVLADWQKSHASCVPRVWLRRYMVSRLNFPGLLADAIASKLK